MTALIEQFIAAFSQMPTAKKITTAIVLTLVVAGLAMMFFWANQIDYQLLYSNLSSEDAGNIVSKLKEQRIPYKFAGGGSSVLVPATHTITQNAGWRPKASVGKLFQLDTA